MKFGEIFNYINSQHTLEVKYQEFPEDGDCIIYGFQVNTDLFGNPQSPVRKDLLQRKIHAFYPNGGMLTVILKDEEESI